jgi:ADP-heptose:LPS heptosyltransferase
MGGPRAKEKPPQHELETNLEIIRPVVEDLVLPPERIEIKVREEDRASLVKKTRAEGLPDGVPFVVLHPGASWRPRAWRPERFAETALQLIEGYPGLHVCFVGSSEDKDLADKISIIVQHPNAHFFFDLKILETAALIERSALFIGSDSGIAHLAAAIGTRSIVLFGPQDPARFRPWSDRTTVLHRPVACFPCKQTKCVVPSNPCVNLVFVDDVMRVAQTVLGDRLEPPRPQPLRPPGPVPGPVPGPLPGPVG